MEGPHGPVSPAVQAALERGKGGQRRTKSEGPGDEYVEVKERIQWFYATYPTGALVTEKVTIITADFARGKQAVMVESAAYRTPDDPHPGRGTSWLVIPGHTPYTNGSEVENAETSSWGRAIAAIGGLVDRGIASAQEIRMRDDGLEPPSRVDGPAAQLAAAAAQAAGATGAPANTPAPAPEPAPAATVQDGATAEPADEAERATETAAEPAVVPEPVPEPEGQGEAKEEAPEATGEGGLSYDEFKRLVRERLIPSGHVAAVARELKEAGIVRADVGSVRAMSDEERLAVMLAAIARLDDTPQNVTK